jgi:hypothetical protein
MGSEQSTVEQQIINKNSPQQKKKAIDTNKSPDKGTVAPKAAINIDLIPS